MHPNIAPGKSLPFGLIDCEGGLSCYYCSRATVLTGRQREWAAEAWARTRTPREGPPAVRETRVW